MMGKWAAGLLLLALSLGACTSDGDGDATPTTPPAPSATQATAEPGATPPPRAVSENGYIAEQVFPNIAIGGMLGMHPIPGEDGFVVVLTQDGVIYRASIEDASQEPTVFLDIRDRIKPDLGTEEGLLGLAFSPEYGTTGEFYIDYTADNPRRNVISRFVSKGDAADPASETVLLEIEQPFPNHNGGALAFGPDDMLYIASGDGGSGGDPQGNGQRLDTMLGKILRVDVSGGEEYTVPDENPFADGGGLPEIWAYGLRNPWRITFDSETGALWAADVGQGEVEEIDIIERGGNYGWNIMEGPECYDADDCDQSGLVLPRASYGHEDGNCSVTGGYVYRGDRLPELEGWYIYGDFCSGLVWGINTSSATTETANPVLLAQTGRAIASFALDASQEFYLVTFNNAIDRLAPAP
ncbi:MAG: PQQ-dependent sugar dehydrogenase [Dehalococcoidia bacterium]